LIPMAKRLPLVLLFTKIIALNANETFDSKDLSSFSLFIQPFCWDFTISHHQSNNSEIKSILHGRFIYQFPEDDGYFPKLEIVEIKFDNLTDIPLFDQSEEQIYEIGYANNIRPGTFPLMKYQSTFRWIQSAVFQEYGKWRAFWTGHKIYLVYKTPTRQKLEPFFSTMVDYFQIGSSEKLKNLEKRLEQQYNSANAIFESIKIVQTALKSQKYDIKSIDGIFGRNTKKAL
jgi:hypothetical protein